MYSTDFYINNGLVTTDVADFEAQRLLWRIYLRIPEVLSLLTVENDVAEFVYLHLRVAVPFTFYYNTPQNQTSCQSAKLVLFLTMFKILWKTLGVSLAAGADSPSECPSFMLLCCMPHKAGSCQYPDVLACCCNSQCTPLFHGTVPDRHQRDSDRCVHAWWCSRNVQSIVLGQAKRHPTGCRAVLCTSLAVHAYLYAFCLQFVHPSWTGELGTLVWVQYFRLAVFSNGFIKHLRAYFQGSLSIRQPESSTAHCGLFPIDRTDVLR